MELLFINKLDISINTKNTYEKIFFLFLSLMLIIGRFSVSAGAYNVIIIIPNIKTKLINMYLYIGCKIIYLLAKTTHNKTNLYL